ncbi:MAG: YqgE/AlgH family protein, partial [Chitinophagaceae bacterium]
GTLTPNDLRIFVGYCGWDSGDLEGELAEGGWSAEALPPDRIFTV